MSEQEYVLGTHDAEIERLGLQHAVWRARAIAAWQRAGFGPGQRILDIGCGPGYATMDIAEIVAPDGQVVALDRSARFLDAARVHAQARPSAQSRASIGRSSSSAHLPMCASRSKKQRVLSCRRGHHHVDSAQP